MAKEGRGKPVAEPGLHVGRWLFVRIFKLCIQTRMKCCGVQSPDFKVIYGVYTLLTMTSLCLAMFTSRTREKLGISISQPIKDVAVCDVDGDGNMEMILVSSRGSNMVLNYDFRRHIYTDVTLSNPSLASIRDEHGSTIGVCACDIDGDGNEEIYLLTNNKRNFNHKVYKDRLLHWQKQFNRFDDLFNDDINSNLSVRYDGHAVGCLDRAGNGRYGVLISDIRDKAASLALIQVKRVQVADNSSSRIVLEDATREANLANTLASRSIAIGPIIGEEGRSDIFMAGFRDDAGHHTKNQLLKNNLVRAFHDIALDTGIMGDQENGRAATLADMNYDGLVDIISVNMMSRHRLYLQHVNGTSNKASKHFEEISSARSVLAVDFDNDGILEILLVNAFYRSPFDTGVSVRSENALYQVQMTDDGVVMTNVSIGDAKTSGQHITGASVADLDGDGLLELYITNEDDNTQSLSIYHVTEGKGNNWLRVMPLTRGGAPARGASVKLVLKTNQILLRIIDPSSNIEPVAHFGLGRSNPIEMTLLWPDGHLIRKSLSSYNINVTLKVAYYGHVTSLLRQKPSLPSLQTTTYATSGTNPGCLSPRSKSRELKVLSLGGRPFPKEIP
ncbi:cartilage acidic protein 1-like [Gigantopelta aegis]|uniref:cartilage acidic protein 1-like n=1 Tax=Gigantopelta aegis TaxID=1735272 RepID=UPI001B88A46D|nr:cartilage acidic protein 1-like [Gigantopelta aegis]